MPAFAPTAPAATDAAAAITARAEDEQTGGAAALAEVRVDPAARVVPEEEDEDVRSEVELPQPATAEAATVRTTAGSHRHPRPANDRHRGIA